MRLAEATDDALVVPLPFTVAREAIFRSPRSIHLLDVDPPDPSPSGGRSGGGRVGDPRFTCVDRVGSCGASADGAVETAESPVSFLVQVRVLSGGGARQSSVAARLRPWHPRIVGSVPCFDPLPDPAWRFPCWRGIRWSFKAAAARKGGVVVADSWRWPWIWSGWCSGPCPGRCGFFVVCASSVELASLAAQQRLRARSTPVPGMADSGGSLRRRLRRWCSCSRFVSRLKKVVRSSGAPCCFPDPLLTCCSSLFRSMYSVCGSIGE